MRILLSNDDGIYASGLAAMYHALREIAEVTVVAPDSPQSGGSHALTFRHPVLWKTVDVPGGFRGTSVEGTPADCIKLGLNELMGAPPDLVVSGINSGLNTGIHVLYSGTVAAAIEGAVLGLPSIAVSKQLEETMDYARAAKIAVPLIQTIVRHGATPRQVYNINIPKFAAGWPKGVRVAPQSLRPTLDKLEKRRDPGGREYYWLSGDFADVDDGADTDIHLIRQGYVCITPLQFDLTRHEALRSMAAWEWSHVE